MRRWLHMTFLCSFNIVRYFFVVNQDSVLYLNAKHIREISIWGLSFWRYQLFLNRFSPCSKAAVLYEMDHYLNTNCKVNSNIVHKEITCSIMRTKILILRQEKIIGRANLSGKKMLQFLLKTEHLSRVKLIYDCRKYKHFNLPWILNL